MEDVRIEHRYNASDFKLGNHHENVYQMLLPMAVSATA